MLTTLAAHTARRPPRSLALRLVRSQRLVSAALGLVLAAIEGRIPQVGRR